MEYGKKGINRKYRKTLSRGLKTVYILIRYIIQSGTFLVPSSHFFNPSEFIVPALTARKNPPMRRPVILSRFHDPLLPLCSQIYSSRLRREEIAGPTPTQRRVPKKLLFSKCSFFLFESFEVVESVFVIAAGLILAEKWVWFSGLGRLDLGLDIAKIALSTTTAALRGSILALSSIRATSPISTPKLLPSRLHRQMPLKNPFSILFPTNPKIKRILPRSPQSR